MKSLRAEKGFDERKKEGILERFLMCLFSTMKAESSYTKPLENVFRKTTSVKAAIIMCGANFKESSLFIFSMHDTFLIFINIENYIRDSAYIIIQK